jgi:hypothetical protein
MCDTAFLQKSFACGTVIYRLDTLRQCVLQRECACDRTQNAAVRQLAGLLSGRLTVIIRASTS